MKLHNKIFLASLFLSVCFGRVQAQKVWTLQECIEYALKNNIQVKQNELNVALSESKYEQSIASMLPTINGSASHNYTFGRTVNAYTNEFTTGRTLSNSFALSSSATLFNGFQLQNTRKQSQYDLVASRYDVEQMRNDIALNVANAYLQVLFSKELVGVAEQQLDVSRQQLDRTQKMVDVGNLPMGSLLDVESQVASEELQVVNAQNQLDLAYLTLSQFMELESPKDFIIESPDLSVPKENILNSTPENIYATAEKGQPQIMSSAYKIQSAGRSLAVARGGRSPRLNLSGSLSTGYSDARRQLKSYQLAFDTIGYTPALDPVLSVFPAFKNSVYETTSFRKQVDDNYSQSIGFNLTIPIFNGWQTKAAIKSAKIALENARYNDQLTKNQLRKTIQQAYADAVAAFKKYKAVEKSVTSMKESFRYVEKKFNVGLISSLDYLTSKNNLTKAESDLLQAKYDYTFKMKTLDFYQGKPLSF